MHNWGSLMIHCSTFRLWYAVAKAWYSAAWTLGLVRELARFREPLTRPVMLISCAFYACRVAYIPSSIRLSLARLPFDMMLSMLLKSVSTCTCIGCLKTNSNRFRIESASSNRSEKAIISVESTKRAMCRDLYKLYETGIASWKSSFKKNTGSIWYHKSALLANVASLYAIIRNSL